MAEKEITIKTLDKKAMKALSDSSKKTHAIWHKFSNWLIKTFGEDLHGEWKTTEWKDAKTGKTKSFKHRSFNDQELSRRLVGYEVMQKIEKYINRSCPEIKIIRCDDSVYSGSFLLLVPHPKHGITIMFIPQCTGVQNQFFLYDGHFEMLTKELAKMKTVYKGGLLDRIKKAKKYSK